MGPSRRTGRDPKKPLATSGASDGTKNSRKPPLSPSSSLASTNIIPILFQQRLLDIFTATFSDLLNPSTTIETLPVLLQEIKGHLYNRDFRKAFGSPRYLEAYALRWSASRTLAYLQIFAEAYPHLDIDQSSPKKETSANRDLLENSVPSAVGITCLGGGAGAELCALAGLCHLLQSSDNNPVSINLRDLKFDVVAIDNANWASVISTLHSALTSSLSISIYASKTARATNTSNISAPLTLTTQFHQHDLLSPSTPSTSPETLSSSPAYDTGDFHSTIHSTNLITLMFTLNELYTASLSSTQNFLLTLTAAAKPGTLLLVVDSPGSYSTVVINGREKRYPMHWLLDHTLLIVASSVVKEERRGVDREEGRDVDREEVMDKCGEVNASAKHAAANDNIKPQQPTSTAQPERAASSPRWGKIMSEPSRWFRLPRGLKYPLRLEDMRFQMHLYRRL